MLLGMYVCVTCIYNDSVSTDIYISFTLTPVVVVAVAPVEGVIGSLAALEEVAVDDDDTSRYRVLEFVVLMTTRQAP